MSDWKRFLVKVTVEYDVFAKRADYAENNVKQLVENSLGSFTEGFEILSIKARETPDGEQTAPGE